MATTEVLATGSTAAQSSDVVLAAGDVANLFLKGAVSTPPGNSIANIEAKTLAGAYEVIWTLNAAIPGGSSISVNGPLTFRINRALGSTCGVERG